MLVDEAKTVYNNNTTVTVVINEAAQETLTLLEQVLKSQNEKMKAGQRSNYSIRCSRAGDRT